MVFFFHRLIKFTVLAALLIFLVSISVWYYLNPIPPDRLVFINGPILTMDKKNRIAEAVLVEKDRIVAVGDKEDILVQAGSDAKVVDLDGKPLLPGFIEAHGHFPGSGLDAIAADLNSPPIGRVVSIIDVKEKLKLQARTVSSGEWIIGFGYDDTLLLERRFLTRKELDAISKKHPIMVMHISGHMSMVNSKALKRLGISKDTPNPKGGEVVRDINGQATGVLKETAHNKARNKALKLSASRLLKLLQNSVEDYTVEGVTTVQSGLTTPDLYKPITLLAGIGLIPQRLVIWPNLDLAKGLSNGKLEPVNNDKVSTGALKITTDGSIPGYTGFLSLPYFRQAQGVNTNYRGYSSISSQELNTLVNQWHSKGWQLALHANGDAAIDMVIDAIGRAQDTSPRKDSRHIMVHSQMARPNQLEAMAELQITPTFFPSHVYYWGDRYQNLFLGGSRASLISPLNTADKMGVRYSIHSDTPVTPIEPFKMAHHAVTRTTRKGSVLGKEERISVIRALRAMTIDAAWQMFLEDDRGSIEPGKWADLIVISENPLELRRELSDITVEQTWIGGVLRYDRNELTE